MKKLVIKDFNQIANGWIHSRNAEYAANISCDQKNPILIRKRYLVLWFSVMNEET